MIRNKLASTCIGVLSRTPDFRGKTRVARVLCRTVGHPFVPTRGGIKLRARVRDSTFWHNFIKYEDFFSSSLSIVSKGEVCIDVGANIGLFSLLASRRVGPLGAVYAFEPSLHEFADLAANMQANQSGNVTAMQLALSDEDRRVRFEHSGELQSGTSHLVSAESESPMATDLVSSVRFDSTAIPRLIDPDTPVFLKIDTEGAELRVLRGMEQFLGTHSVKTIVCEVGQSNLKRFNATADELFRFMSEHGFCATIQSDQPHYDEIFSR